MSKMNNSYSHNMNFVDYIKSYNNYFKDSTIQWYYTIRAYKNYFQVINKIKKNKFPFQVVLRNGKKLILKNKFQAKILPKIWHSCDFDDGMALIKNNGFEGIKLLNWEENGDIRSIFLSEEYRTLDVKGKVVIDIGANIGDSAIYFAKKGAKKIIGIEPLVNNYDVAKKNVELNGLSEKIELRLIGCGCEKNTRKISTERKGVYYSLVEDDPEGMDVSITTLDEIIEKIDDEIVLKIDCEGCEYEIILGSQNDVLKKFSHIAIEYHRGYKNLKTKLEDCGFRVSVTTPHYNRNRVLNQKSGSHVGFVYAKK